MYTVYIKAKDIIMANIWFYVFYARLV